jgi:hypothetical protein
LVTRSSMDHSIQPQRLSLTLVRSTTKERAALQTADIARRLMRGSELHQEEGA